MADVEATILEAANGSGEGRLHFGQVIGLLRQAGVESYVADYRSNRTTYYMPDGETHEIGLGEGKVDIGQAFDTGLVVAAIRGAQQGSVMYPDFKRLTQEAGGIGYTVWIAGRNVVYFGRKGESHVEMFPN